MQKLTSSQLSPCALFRVRICIFEKVSLQYLFCHWPLLQVALTMLWTQLVVPYFVYGFAFLTKSVCNTYSATGMQSVALSLLVVCLSLNSCIFKSSVSKVHWVVGCWCDYLSGARCRLAYGPADATATHCLLLERDNRWWDFGMQWHQLDHMQTICISLSTDNHTKPDHLIFFRLDALPDDQPTVSKDWRHSVPPFNNNNNNTSTIFMVCSSWPKSLWEFARFIWWMQTERQVDTKFANPMAKPIEFQSFWKCERIY